MQCQYFLCVHKHNIYVIMFVITIHFEYFMINKSALQPTYKFSFPRPNFMAQPINWCFTSVLKIQGAAGCPQCRYGACSINVLVHGKYLCKIWHAYNIPTMQLFSGISRNTIGVPDNMDMNIIAKKIQHRVSLCSPCLA